MKNYYLSVADIHNANLSWSKYTWPNYVSKTLNEGLKLFLFLDLIDTEGNW
jgi:hypothetical protein